MIYNSGDRGLRNVGALAFASLPSVRVSDVPKLREFQIDDVVIRGASVSALVENTEISQLDCRAADLAALQFQQSTIGSLIADNATRVSQSFPIPKKMILEDGLETVDPGEIEGWLDQHGRGAERDVVVGLASASLRAKPIYQLLMKAARTRQYWLRGEGDDAQAKRIIGDSCWTDLRRLLAKHDFLRVESRQAAGRRSEFFHVKHKDRLLAQPAGDAGLIRLFEELERV
jgi:hypothetical protein